MIIYFQFARRAGDNEAEFDRIHRQLRTHLQIKEVKKGKYMDEGRGELDILQVKIDWRDTYSMLFKEVIRDAGEVYQYFIRES